ncbi:GNAT family N-acetyltransferase [Draconibacterium mangrovi]|uniref:GNAT family N-acetyltransferase n=1 Tax=Draconibacterium mangrovi TaxID=2697469 RepID=UPI0013CF75E9|nr:GNAT family N-acetyltransferase [Draconibacterium mangrovi]
MIELEPDKYSLLEAPLKEVKINHLFARSVIEKKVRGKVFVDNKENPNTFYVIHPYGMSLLFGDTKNETFNRLFLNYCLNCNKERKTHEWMQAFPNDWDDTLKTLFEGKLISAPDSGDTPDEFVELNTRVNFKFNLEKYLVFKRNAIKNNYSIIRTDKNSFREMKGSVVPARFWNNADDFCKNGVGFSLYYKEKLATTAYSAFIFDKELELGMETFPEFRGKGFAQHACSALIDYCLTNKYEPVWACKLTNIASYKLAQKLGFIPDITLPYYRLVL